MGRWAVHLCELGSNSWWDRDTGVDPTQPLTLALTQTPTRTQNGRETRLRRFRYISIISICGPPHSPRSMRECTNYSPKTRAATLLGLLVLLPTHLSLSHNHCIRNEQRQPLAQSQKRVQGVLRSTPPPAPTLRPNVGRASFRSRNGAPSRSELRGQRLNDKRKQMSNAPLPPSLSRPPPYCNCTPLP